jgi:hypothetical protein
LDLTDHGRIAHSGNSAVATDVGGDALKGHNSAGPSVFGNFGLLGINDVHNHAASKHLGKPYFYSEGVLIVHWHQSIYARRFALAQLRDKRGDQKAAASQSEMNYAGITSGDKP